jgi:hypothetical protein
MGALAGPFGVARAPHPLRQIALNLNVEVIIAAAQQRCSAK